LGFSAKTTYALLALIELADVQASGERLQVGEIATRQRIPERYLEQMMTALRRGGFVRSSRGPRGGYVLARSPEAVTLAEVLTCLEGGPDKLASEQQSPEQSVVVSLSEQLRQRRMATLEETSLADLVQERDALLQAQSQTMYFI
jgi:Rrf2 family protein